MTIPHYLQSLYAAQNKHNKEIREKFFSHPNVQETRNPPEEILAKMNDVSEKSVPVEFYSELSERPNLIKKLVSNGVTTMEQLHRELKDKKFITNIEVGFIKKKIFGQKI